MKNIIVTILSILIYKLGLCQSHISIQHEQVTLFDSCNSGFEINIDNNYKILNSTKFVFKMKQGGKLYYNKHGQLTKFDLYENDSIFQKNMNILYIPEKESDPCFFSCDSVLIGTISDLKNTVFFVTNKTADSVHFVFFENGELRLKGFLVQNKLDYSSLSLFFNRHEFKVKKESEQNGFINSTTEYISESVFYKPNRFFKRYIKNSHVYEKNDDNTIRFYCEKLVGMSATFAPITLYCQTNKIKWSR